MTSSDKFNLSGHGKHPGSPGSDLASRIAAFKPVDAQADDVEKLARRAADATGFTSREGTATSVSYTIPRRQKRPAEPTHPLNMRPPVSVVQRYIALAESLRMSYPQLLELLLDQYDRNPTR